MVEHETIKLKYDKFGVPMHHHREELQQVGARMTWRGKLWLVACVAGAVGITTANAFLDYSVAERLILGFLALLLEGMEAIHAYGSVDKKAW